MKKLDIIKELKEYFGISELVCPHVYNRFGEKAWMFLDYRLLHTLLIIRRDIVKKPMIINNSTRTQSGIRCNMCELVKNKTSVYMSAHVLGKAVDAITSGMTADEVRNLIIENKDLLPYPVRLEAGVSWLHFDVYEDDVNTHEKVSTFNA